MVLMDLFWLKNLHFLKTNGNNVTVKWGGIINLFPVQLNVFQEFIVNQWKYLKAVTLFQKYPDTTWFALDRNDLTLLPDFRTQY